MDCRVILPAYGAGPYLPTIVLDRPIFIREMHDGLYTPLTYLTYKAGSLFCPFGGAWSYGCACLLLAQAAVLLLHWHVCQAACWTGPSSAGRCKMACTRP